MARSTERFPDGRARSVVLGAIWRARWVLIAAVLVAGVGGYLVSASQPSVYMAQSRLLLSESAPFSPTGGQSFNDPTRYLSNQISLMTSGPVLNLAVERLGEDLSAGELGASLQVEPAGSNDLIVVQATAPSADAAADRANAVVAAYQQYVLRQVTEVADAATAATTTPSVIDQVRTEEATYGDGVLFVETASEPEAPFSPVPARDAILLAAVAALLGVGVALWRRGPVAESGDLVEATGARLLGSVPVHSTGRGRGRIAEPEQFALTLVALEYARRETPGPVLVTGAGPGSGAEALAHGLAVSAVQQGMRVLLVAAEPERQAVLAHLQASPPRRPLDVLAAGASRGEVLLPLVLPGKGTGSVTLTALDKEPLRTDRVGAALRQLAGEYDLVLVQVGPVADDPRAFALVEHAAGAVAAVAERDAPEQVQVLRDRLEAAQRPLIGVVLTRPARSGKGVAAPLKPAEANVATTNPVSPPPVPAPVSGDNAPSLSRPR